MNVPESDAATLGCEKSGRRQANPTGAAGDNGRVLVEFEVHVKSRVPF
jgi:hypothetical protein